MLMPCAPFAPAPGAPTDEAHSGLPMPWPDQLTVGVVAGARDRSATSEVSRLSMLPEHPG